ncbi:MAG: GNAT family N-acetyltransferase [Rhodospirillales bacterium]
MRVVAALFREYQAWLDAPICFKDFEAELDNLGSVYRPPGGELWLARIGATVVGVVGMKPAAAPADLPSCEMKRLYVRDSWRGLGVGRKMAKVCIEWAAGAGYASVCLETLDRLSEARALYRSLGFSELSDGHNALETPIFMDLPLPSMDVAR